MISSGSCKQEMNRHQQSATHSQAWIFTVNKTQTGSLYSTWTLKGLYIQYSHPLIQGLCFLNNIHIHWIYSLETWSISTNPELTKCCFGKISMNCKTCLYCQDCWACPHWAGSIHEWLYVTEKQIKSLFLWRIVTLILERIKFLWIWIFQRVTFVLSASPHTQLTLPPLVTLKGVFPPHFHQVLAHKSSGGSLAYNIMHFEVTVVINKT